jgi:hypothetical protein
VTALSQQQIETFQRDGFYAPIDALSADEARRLRGDLEDFERTLPSGPIPARDRRKLHVRLPWARALVEDPRILDVMEALLGPDILVFTSTFFIKEPRSDAITAWHQDATFFGLSPYEHVTAWVAFSDATVEAGCMEFILGSHRWGQLRHGGAVVPGSINAGGQAITQPLDTARTALAPLAAGQLSLHHTLVVHDSAPNRSADRRIGLGISYIPTRLRHSGSRPMSATLVRGVDRYGHFDLEADPRDLDPAARIAAHHRAYATYHALYEEQMQRHPRAVA